MVVVRFGEKYKQWNAAFDAGFAAALGKPIVTLHPPDHDHALKEIDRAAHGDRRDRPSRWWRSSATCSTVSCPLALRGAQAGAFAP